MIQPQPNIWTVFDQGPYGDEVGPARTGNEHGNQTAPGTDGEIHASVCQSRQVAKSGHATHQFDLQTKIAEESQLYRVVPGRPAVVQYPGHANFDLIHALTVHRFPGNFEVGQQIVGEIALRREILLDTGQNALKFSVTITGFFRGRAILTVNWGDSHRSGTGT